MRKALVSALMVFAAWMISPIAWAQLGANPIADLLPAGNPVPDQIVPYIPTSVIPSSLPGPDPIGDYCNTPICIYPDNPFINGGLGGYPSDQDCFDSYYYHDWGYPSGNYYHSLDYDLYNCSPSAWVNELYHPRNLADNIQYWIDHGPENDPDQARGCYNPYEYDAILYCGADAVYDDWEYQSTVSLVNFTYQNCRDNCWWDPRPEIQTLETMILGDAGTLENLALIAAGQAQADGQQIAADIVDGGLNNAITLAEAQWAWITGTYLPDDLYPALQSIYSTTNQGLLTTWSWLKGINQFPLPAQIPSQFPLPLPSQLPPYPGYLITNAASTPPVLRSVPGAAAGVLQ